MGTTAPIRLLARPAAKVNLTLAVGRRAEHGYHPLRSVFLRIGLVDELVVMAAPLLEVDTLQVRGLPGCPVEGNLVLRALALLRREIDQPLLPLRAQLDKRIPMGAGLGGGSSDAAATVELALRAWGASVTAARLSELALELGSDVPFFASGAPAALVEGRGERVGALPAVTGGAGVLLATFGEPLSTGRVFATFDELDVETAAAGAATDELAAALSAGMSGKRLAARAHALRDANNLWPAAVALAPALGSARDALETASGVPWLLSGSGSSLFSLHESRSAADRVGRSLAEQRLEPLSEMVLHAVDLDGAAEAWRFP